MQRPRVRLAAHSSAPSLILSLPAAPGLLLVFSPPQPFAASQPALPPPTAAALAALQSHTVCFLPTPAHARAFLSAPPLRGKAGGVAAVVTWGLAAAHASAQELARTMAALVECGAAEIVIGEAPGWEAREVPVLREGGRGLRELEKGDERVVGRRVQVGRVMGRWVRIERADGHGHGHALDEGKGKEKERLVVGVDDKVARVAKDGSEE